MRKIMIRKASLCDDPLSIFRSISGERGCPKDADENVVDGWMFDDQLKIDKIER